jgi:hypothetical protein
VDSTKKDKKKGRKPFAVASNLSHTSLFLQEVELRKRAWIVVLVFGLLVMGRAQVPPQREQMKPEDVQKALSLVEKPQPAPEKFQPGLAAITAKDSMAMLTFVASDSLEGRETGTRGFVTAAEYAASLFKLWGIQPAGDMPRPSFNFRMFGGQRQAPANPPERTYFQEFGLRKVTDTESQVTIELSLGGAVKAHAYQGGVDYQSPYSAAAETITAPVVFVGYGITEPSLKWDELKGLNLKGKIVLMLTEAPGKDDPKSPFNSTKELKDKYFPQGGNMMMMYRMRGGPGRFNKAAEIAKLDPAAIVMVQNTGSDADIFKALSTPRQPNDERPIINKPRYRLSIPGDTLPQMGAGRALTLSITREMANFLLEGTGQAIDDLKKKIETTYKPASMDVPGVKMTIATTAKTELIHGLNVLGVIEGSDPKLKDEYFVVGAHCDHLGRWEDYIYNGADDNGSGSVGVLNIAKAMAASPVKPKRSIVFALWTGEEEGLLGSRYYVENPMFPLERTVGYLNFDMISRPYDTETLTRGLRMFNVPGAEEIVKKVRAPSFVTVNLTDGTPFAEIAREMNNYVGLDLAFRPNPLGEGSGGSDQASFAAVKKPFIYYMAAMTSDYHQTSDTADKVSGDLIAKISQHGFLTVYAYADR